MLHERIILVVSLGPILRQVVIHVLRPEDLRSALSFFQFSAHLSRGAPSGCSSHRMPPGGFVIAVVSFCYVLTFSQDMWMRGRAHWWAIFCIGLEMSPKRPCTSMLRFYLLHARAFFRRLVQTNDKTRRLTGGIALMRNVHHHSHNTRFLFIRKRFIRN